MEEGGQEEDLEVGGGQEEGHTPDDKHQGCFLHFIFLLC